MTDRKMLRWLLCGLGIVFSGASMATSPAPIGAEYATLPPYCKEKIEKTDSVANKIWSDKFGKDNWLHMHHYCMGLNYLINRHYRARTKVDRAWTLGEAVDNISYTIKGATPGFTLLPEMYFNRGKTLRLLGRSPEAISDWLKAKTLNPEYVATYIALADYYAEIKQQDKALEMVSEGLRHVPSSKGLQRRYQELGGKLPFPEPYEKPAEQNTAAETKAVADAPATDNAPSNSSEAETPKPAETKPAIGMPGNPYCRFCTD
jgi:tetratricopeptide (TPR) repeat protein